MVCSRAYLPPGRGNDAADRYGLHNAKNDLRLMLPNVTGKTVDVLIEIVVVVIDDDDGQT